MLGRPGGVLHIQGGGERYENRAVWEAFARDCGGPGSAVGIVATASSRPRHYGEELARHLHGLGLRPRLLPMAAELDPRPLEEVVGDPAVSQQIRECRGVFLVGGDQARLREAFVGPNGEPTPALASMIDVYWRGGAIGGSSAGAAVMSQYMIRSAERVWSVLAGGMEFGRHLDFGLGFLPGSWMVDQHFQQRGRLARLLLAMHSLRVPYGLGVDENTAVVIEQATTAHVVGQHGVTLLDLSHAVSNPDEPRFNLSGARLSFLCAGDQFDVVTREVTPAAERRSGTAHDPNQPGFEPSWSHRPFTTDILAPFSAPRLVSQLIDCPHGDAIGMAFCGESACAGETLGFEFRFRRGPETIAWDSDVSGGDDWTVLGIELDVRPVTIRGPLYDPAGERML